MEIMYDVKLYDQIVSHGPACSDGLCAMWVATRYHKQNRSEFIQQYLNTHTTEIDVYNTSILFMDYSPTYDQLLVLLSRGNRVTIIDHHLTTVSHLSPLLNIDYEKIYPTLKLIIDINKSAGELVWDYFYGNNYPCPLFIQYIGDRDLWLWRLPNSKNINKAFDIKDLIQFKKFDKLYKKETSGDVVKNLYYNKLSHMGSICLLAENRLLQKMAKGSILVKMDIYNVRVVSQYVLINELGSYLCESSDCDFALIWKYNPIKDTIYVSLRGTDKSPDLSKIAEKFGGGGHRNASSFCINEVSGKWSHGVFDINNIRGSTIKNMINFIKINIRDDSY